MLTGIQINQLIDINNELLLMNNELEYGILRVDPSDKVIHVASEHFLSTFKDYQEQPFDETCSEIFTFVDGVKFFALKRAEVEED